MRKKEIRAKQNKKEGCKLKHNFIDSYVYIDKNFPIKGRNYKIMELKYKIETKQKKQNIL